MEGSRSKMYASLTFREELDVCRHTPASAFLDLAESSYTESMT
jgi:hypothetical protein